MAGDGANDAAAIRLADVGVALGSHATNAAKDAADVVVTDDRIETIIEAILEGRAMWASVRDAVSVLVGGNLGEIVFTLGAELLLPGGSPLNARQLLLVNLLTDLVPSMALAARPPAGTDPARLAREGPEASLGAALTRDVLVRGGLTATAAGLGWQAGRLTGVTRGRAGTVALVSLVGSQLGQTLAAGWRDPLVVGSTAVSAAVLAGVVQTPGLSHFFGCRPLGPRRLDHRRRGDRRLVRALARGQPPRRGCGAPGLSAGRRQRSRFAPAVPGPYYWASVRSRVPSLPGIPSSYDGRGVLQTRM